MKSGAFLERKHRRTRFATLDAIYVPRLYISAREPMKSRYYEAHTFTDPDFHTTVTNLVFSKNSVNNIVEILSEIVS